MTAAPGPVTLPWVHKLPWKQQSALFSALRGPDTGYSPQVKRLHKLVRMASQHDADPATDYMRAKPVDLAQLERELEFCSLHHVAHLVEGLHILTQHCPHASWRTEARVLLEWFTRTYHLAYEHVA